MKSDIYKSAMDRIVAGEEFRKRVREKTGRPEPRRVTGRRKSLAAALAAILILVLGAIPLIMKGRGEEGFRITGESTGAEASHRAVLYYEGYVYEPSPAMDLTRFGMYEYLRKDIKGQKMGEVTLDLTGKKFVGTPPDFSSTSNVSSSIYVVKGVKVERALIVEEGEGFRVYYRKYRYSADEDKPLYLTLGEVFSMLSSSPEISALEIRDPANGMMLNSFEGPEILSPLKSELPGLSLLTKKQLGKNPEMLEGAIFVNLNFTDGVAIPMVIYPKSYCAYVFGGFINLAPKLCETIQSLNLHRRKFPSIAELSGLTKEEVSYLYFDSIKKGYNITAQKPEESRKPLFDIFNYYTVREIQKTDDMMPALVIRMGKSDREFAELVFYERKQGDMIVNIGGKYYVPVKGMIFYKELGDYLSNHV